MHDNYRPSFPLRRKKDYPKEIRTPDGLAYESYGGSLYPFVNNDDREFAWLGAKAEAQPVPDGVFESIDSESPFFQVIPTGKIYRYEDGNPRSRSIVLRGIIWFGLTKPQTEKEEHHENKSN